MLASGDLDGVLMLWETLTGRQRQRLVGHECGIHSLAFSPDGRLLASASFDAPVYLWDVTGRFAPPRRPPSEEQLRRCWAELANPDAAAAYQAMRRLTASSKQALPLLRQHLKPVSAPDLKRVRQLVAMLDSDEYATRQKATRELDDLADAGASTLAQAVKEAPSLEVRRRLEQILEGKQAAPETLRAVRAVEVLEWIATADAARLLDDLAKGAAEARLTREAGAARQRLRLAP